MEAFEVSGWLNSFMSLSDNTEHIYNCYCTCVHMYSMYLYVITKHHYFDITFFFLFVVGVYVCFSRRGYLLLGTRKTSLT